MDEITLQWTLCEGAKMTSTEAKPGQPTLVHTPLGWTVQLLDKEGKDILNLAVFPSQFLAEEALKRMITRQPSAA
jgi:hypothetical protein